MKKAIAIAAVLIVVILIVQAVRQRRLVNEGLRLFAGCPEGVDRKATEASGEFVCRGTPDPASFGGNGRTCGSCHTPGDRFGMSVTRIATLAPTHPFLFPGIDEDLPLLRAHGLVHVVDADEDGLNEFRPTPKLVHLQRLCNGNGECDALGLLGDRETDLCTFSREAVANHLTKTVARVPGVDFRVMSDRECRALVAYMLSDLVADQGRDSE